MTNEPTEAAYDAGYKRGRAGLNGEAPIAEASGDPSKWWEGWAKGAQDRFKDSATGADADASD